MEPRKVKTGLFKLGYLDNRATCLEDLQLMLAGTEAIADFSVITDCIENNTIELFNGAGYVKFPDGTVVAEATAKYKKFVTPYKTMSGDSVYGWFHRQKPQNSTFTGVSWGTESDFRKTIKRNNAFMMGSIYFDTLEDGLAFLEDIASKILPESWRYKNKSSSINHPILKSYLENILERLKQEVGNGANEKILYSSNKKYAMFNTNLLDKYFHDVILAAEIESDGNEEFFHNPFHIKSTSEKIKLNLPKTTPKQPRFFDNVNEVIFQTHWDIDNDFDTFTHIIEERRDRFPDEYKNTSSDDLAKLLDKAIESAVVIAQRNYKFIVPMYRPQNDSIQLLMPIYLKGSFNDRPDFALILTPDEKNEMYIPETILPLDAVYQNARLIAKPDESWLNPDTIQ